MSHTLHREGTVESLSHDFVVFMMAAQTVNKPGSKEKLQEFWKIAKKYNPVNMGDGRTGNMLTTDYDEMIGNMKDGVVAHTVFDNEDAVAGFLNELREADLGISVIVSGLFDKVGECCKKAGLSPHTVNMSLGIHGKTEKLAPDDHREISTMCGHGMITARMIDDMVAKIKKGVLTPEGASKKLGELCICGVYNPVRAASLLEKLAAK